MASRILPDPADLENTIGYRFEDRRVLQRALTHMSALTAQEDRVASYQRLEFLGDRVLALVIADNLLRAYPDADEGELARRLNRLVKAETCTAVARDIDLGAYLILGDGENASGGRGKKAILADACEALIAAIYRDGGMKPARQFIESHWQKRMMERSGPLRDAKTMLQEWAHARALDTPVYELVSRSGPDHAPLFEMRAKVAGLDPAAAEGSSKRQAEQNAARALLTREGGWPTDASS